MRARTRLKRSARRARLRVWRVQRKSRQARHRLLPASLAATQVVDGFDYWAYRHELQRDVSAALTRANVEHLVLDDRLLARPLVVIRRADFARARAALAADPRTATCAAAQCVNSVTGPPARVRVAQPLFTHTSGLLVTRNLIAPTGVPLVHPEWGVLIDLWDDAATARFAPAGGTPPPSALVARTPNGVVGHVTETVWRQAQREDHRLPARPPHLLEVAEPVDLVYTWVNGSDPAWQQRKARYLGGGLSIAAHSADSAIGARFENRDELRFSLRSVQSYANWVRHIWIVTDQQVPGWLRTDHPRLTVVDHRDIFSDPAALPSFNSHAIESQLHHIPGLANLYVYLNDDVMFGSPVRPENFFHGNGLVKFFASSAPVEPREPSGHDVAVTAAAKNNRALIEHALGRTITSKLRHGPMPQSVALLTMLEAEQPELFDRVMRARFRRRSDNAIASSLAQYYGFARGLAVPGRLRTGYLDVANPLAEHVLERWLRGRDYHSLCLNDSGTDDPRVNALLTDFFDAYFPLPSEWER